MEISCPIFGLSLEIFNLIDRCFLCWSMGRETNGLVVGGGVQFGCFGTRILLAHDERAGAASAK